MILCSILIVIFLYICAKIFFAKKKDLHGQIALVTGAANGLGKELALQLAEQGCKIIVADIDIETAKETVKEILAKNYKTEAKAYKVDVSNLNEIEELRNNINKDFGTVDLLINNAGIIFVQSIDNEKPEVLQKMLNVNVMSLVWTTRVFLEDMINKKRGHIVSISSLSGLIGAPSLRLYATTKFAVRGFMEALYTDLHMEGHGEYIKTTTVFPSFINTNKAVRNFTKEYFKSVIVFDIKTSTKQIVEGIQFNHRIITIPRILFIIGYVIQIPAPIIKYVLKWITHNQR